MEIILIRHTAPAIAKGICYGQSDVDVMPSFEKEMQQIQQQLPNDIHNYTVYASPLRRCEKLAQTLFTTVVFDNRLKELNFGDWELQKWNEINQEELTLWMDNFVTEKTKNGESYLDLHQRTTNFIADLQQQNIQKAIVVTHAGVMRSLWAYTNDIPLEKSFELPLNYGELLKIIL